MDEVDEGGRTEIGGTGGDRPVKRPIFRYEILNGGVLRRETFHEFTADTVGGGFGARRQSVCP